ncbi:MAG: tetratricopeptide repeat protein [Rhizobiaceae bacterium]|nr:tetratricopeptide repeat protein [Rhizobiaceae bacterium]
MNGANSVLSGPAVDDSQSFDPPLDCTTPLVELLKKENFEQVASEADLLLNVFPKSVTLLSLGVSANARLGNKAKAEEYARQTVLHHPNLASGYLNLGIALRSQDKFDEALDAFSRAAELDERLASAHFHRGLLLVRNGDVDGAIASFDRAVAIRPNYAAAHYNRAGALVSKGEHRAALAAYDAFLRLKPESAEAWNNKGVEHLALMEMSLAADALRKAVQLQPDLAPAYDNLGTVLCGMEDLPNAVAAFDQAVRLNPESHSALTQKLFAEARMCRFVPNVAAAADRAGDDVTPFWLMSLQDSPERQVGRAAHQWKRRAGAIAPLPLPARPVSRPARLRIGYFSSDIHEHATLYLMSGLIREHDRNRFEIFMYSYGLGKEGRQRERVVNSDLRFHDIESLSAHDIVKLVRSHRLDIAIDLKGYTSGTRSELFGYRFAPIQINYLGYPGTMSTEAMDYIIADKTIIPMELRQFYSEKILYMPHTYQPNDDQREIAPISTGRSDFGLPENGFVFCCFNNSYKITAEEFSIWMRLLGKLNGSVLWLLSSNVWMEQNLRQEAISRGVDPARLVFSKKVPHEEHLARLQHADLVVDCFNYNAHTTASDALWTGLPIVTRIGRQFSARVAASLLNAIGLSELVTRTSEEYEAKILDLATRPEELNRIRKRLERNRLARPLFDTVRYTRNFEAGLELAYDRYFAGKLPADITIPDIDDSKFGRL